MSAFTLPDARGVIVTRTIATPTSTSAPSTSLPVCDRWALGKPKAIGSPSPYRRASSSTTGFSAPCSQERCRYHSRYLDASARWMTIFGRRKACYARARRGSCWRVSGTGAFSREPRPSSTRCACPSFAYPSGAVARGQRSRSRRMLWGSFNSLRARPMHPRPLR